MAYDWNPVNGTRGNLLVTLSIVIVTSREEFNFSSKYTYTNTHTHSLTNTYLLLHCSLVITNKVNTNLCRAQIQTIIIYLYSLILQNSVLKKAILISSVCPPNLLLPFLLLHLHPKAPLLLVHMTLPSLFLIDYLSHSNSVYLILEA